MSQQKFVYDAPKGTVKAYGGFQSEEDAKCLRAAMKGLGTDEKAIIEIVSMRSNAQRLEIEAKYKQLFGRDLKHDLKDELSGDFEDTVLALFYAPIDYDVYCLHQAMCGVGTDEEALIEILASRSNDEIKKIKCAYEAKYGKSLEAAIKDDTSGHFRKFLVILLQAARDESQCIDEAQGERDAKDLYEAGEKYWGTDESKFNEIMCNRSFPQLRYIFYQYEKSTGHSITKAISNEFSGDMEKGLKAIVEIAYYLPHYFAELLVRAMSGPGTNDSTLIRVIVSRCEVDLHEIKEEFHKITGKSLYKWVKDDTSGDYKRMLVALIVD